MAARPEDLNPAAGDVAHPATRRILGTSDAIRRCREEIEQLGPENIPVHIQGPTGAGKELVAQALHAVSGRSGEFVAVNCGGVTETLNESEFLGHEKGAFTGAHAAKRGHFKQAHRGTLFLDEIDKLALSTQATLLRVLDNGVVTRVGSTRSTRVDFRLVTASNVDLRALADGGAFLPDLYWRIMGAEITLPPLRERREDIPILARHFLDGSTLSDEACALLLRYDWPGNVRQLARTVELAEIHARPGEIRPEHLPPEVRASAEGAEMPNDAPHPFNLLAWKKALVSAALEQTGGNSTGAAEKLGIAPTSVVRIAERWGWEDRISRRGA